MVFKGIKEIIIWYGEANSTRTYSEKILVCYAGEHRGIIELDGVFIQNNISRRISV